MQIHNLAYQISPLWTWLQVNQDNVAASHCWLFSLVMAFYVPIFNLCYNSNFVLWKNKSLLYSFIYINSIYSYLLFLSINLLISIQCLKVVLIWLYTYVKYSFLSLKLYQLPLSKNALFKFAECGAGQGRLSEEFIVNMVKVDSSPIVMMSITNCF